MNFYLFKPEVTGGEGINQVMDVSTHPPIVYKLHHEIAGWLGSDIITCHPTYMVTEKLKIYLEKSNYTGFEFDDCLISIDEQFQLFYPNIVPTIPKFYWLKIIGKAFQDDLSLINLTELLISESFLNTLINNFDIENAYFMIYDEHFDRKKFEQYMHGEYLKKFEIDFNGGDYAY